MTDEEKAERRKYFEQRTRFPAGTGIREEASAILQMKRMMRRRDQQREQEMFGDYIGGDGKVKSDEPRVVNKSRDNIREFYEKKSQQKRKATNKDDCNIS